MAGCSVISTPEGEARQPVYCIFTPWKFHVSLIDLVSQLAWQLQLTPSTTHDWQRLPPPPYAPHFFFFFPHAVITPVARLNMHGAGARVLMVSMHARVQFWNAGGDARLDRELIPLQRQLSQSGGGQRERQGREKGRERGRERGVNLTPGNRCPINIFP